MGKKDSGGSGRVANGSDEKNKEDQRKDGGKILAISTQNQSAIRNRVGEGETSNRGIA